MADAMKQLTVWLLLVVTISCAEAARSRYEDDIDLGMRSGGMIKMLREMVNQTNATAADSLNLPANASSIRENITDTFSCENRTYGYYADVDNECQIFHVCLPTQTSSGRNVTYKWSFICPNETVFNQEVLVCTRPEDAIDCADSPMYYDRNDEIGKVNTTTSDSNTTNATPTNNKLSNNSNMKRKENKRKQNLVMAEGAMMDDDKEEIMADGMIIGDSEKENMMADVDKIKRKAVKKKKNTVMMMGGDEKEIMANGMATGTNTAEEMNKEDISMKPMSVMIANSHKDNAQNTNGMKPANTYMTDSIINEDSYRKPLVERMKSPVVHKKTIVNAMKKEQENMKKQMKDKDVTEYNIELTDTNKDVEPIAEEVVSNFGTSDIFEDPIEIINDRMALERSFKRNGKRIKRRGSFRFKADV